MLIEKLKRMRVSKLKDLGGGMDGVKNISGNFKDLLSILLRCNLCLMILESQ